MTTPFRERPEFLMGRNGERQVAAYLQSLGYYVIPSYDYSGDDGDKPPRLQGAKDEYPVPDLDVARKGARRWVEVKTKTCAVLWRRTNQLRHGINRRHYESYLKVQAETGSDVWLAIIETSTGALLIQSLAVLGQPETGTDRGTPMAYWPRDRFRLLATLPGVGGEAA